MTRRAYLPLLIAIGLTIGNGALAKDAIAPPPRPNPGVTIEVVPGDSPHCRTDKKDKDIKDSASRHSEKRHDYKDCFKTHAGSVRSIK